GPRDVREPARASRPPRGAGRWRPPARSRARRGGRPGDGEEEGGPARLARRNIDRLGAAPADRTPGPQESGRRRCDAPRLTTSDSGDGDDARRSVEEPRRRRAADRNTAGIRAVDTGTAAPPRRRPTRTAAGRRTRSRH